MAELVVPVSIVIPTFGRNAVLTDTLASLFSLETPATEILVMDQTPQHDSATASLLGRWRDENRIVWHRLTQPSITKAMNQGLSLASSPLVLFVDDDIEVDSDLVALHAQTLSTSPSLWASVGRVVQPWQTAEAILAPRNKIGIQTDYDFPFHSTIDQDVENVMAGNLCVHRERALSIGGFDENFQGSAYRFETEFAKRIGKAGGSIRFNGGAGIRHLRVASGGTRQSGSHLVSASPSHGIGDHYYAFLHGTKRESWEYSIKRLVREVTTKFHATHPWWIPVKMIGELRAMWGGAVMAKQRKLEASGKRS